MRRARSLARVPEGVDAPRSTMLVHADDLGYRGRPMGLWTGAFVLRADADAAGDDDDGGASDGGRYGTLWKLVVNSTEAHWCNPDSYLYRSNGRCWTLPTTWAEDIAEGALNATDGIGYEVRLSSC